MALDTRPNPLTDVGETFRAGTRDVNLLPLVSTLSIRNKNRDVIPLVPNPAQLAVIREIEYQYGAGLPIRIVNLKARQLGISTITEAVDFLFCFAFPNTNALIVAHEDDSNTHLLNITMHYWETWPFRSLYSTKYAGRKHLEWQESASGIQVVTAGGKGGGRSRTIHFLHASEVAFWPNPDLMLGLRQTVPNLPGTFIMLESTAKGIGNYFHSTWLQAVAGDSEFVPMFFPWWFHNEYTLPGVPLLHKTDEERALTALLGAGMRVNERLTIPAVPAEDIDARLAWRRWAIKNLAENDQLKFEQEYPATPEEAFLSTGRNVFPNQALKVVYEPMAGEQGYLYRDISTNTIKFARDPNGPLTIFRHPSPDADYGRYFIGGDPTRTTRGDFAVAQIINRRTLEQVAVLRKRVDPIHYASDLSDLGHFYNDAMLSTETTGPGYATVGALVAMNYPNMWQAKWADKTPGNLADQYGFASNVQRKHWAIGMLLSVISDHSIKLHHAITYAELSKYVTLDNGGFGPVDEQQGGFDDCVTSLAIAVLCHLTEPPLPPYGSMQPQSEMRNALNAAKNAVGQTLIMPERDPYGDDDYYDERMGGY